MVKFGEYIITLKRVSTGKIRKVLVTASSLEGARKKIHISPVNPDYVIVQIKKKKRSLTKYLK